MADEIRVGDWVEAKASGKKGRVLGADPDTVEVSIIGRGAWHYYRDMVRKLSLDELPPEAWSLTMKNTQEHLVMLPENQKSSKYHKSIKGIDVDVYDILQAYNVTNPAAQHAIKKMLMPGKRGHKDTIEDYQEAISSLERAIELEEENGE